MTVLRQYTAQYKAKNDNDNDNESEFV